MIDAARSRWYPLAASGAVGGAGGLFTYVCILTSFGTNDTPSTEFGTNRKLICDFLLVINTNLALSENGTVNVNILVLTAATHANDFLCLLHDIVRQISCAGDQPTRY